MKLPLLGGAYQASSLIASAQRCVNLYPEQNPGDAEFPTTYHLTPGLVLRATAPLRAFRGLFTASSGDLFAVVANSVYRVLEDWSFTLLGTVASTSGPVSMEDNSLTLVIVDGTEAGYTVDLTTYDFAQINDPGFYGSPRVSVLDDFMIFNQPGTRQFYVTGALAVTFDPLDIAAKNGAPDKTVANAVVNGVIWIFGQRTTEIWYNSGDADFAFSRYPGVFIQHGCAAAATVSNVDTSVYWLSSDDKGAAFIFRSSDMSALRISTHALEAEMKGYPRVDDAFAYSHTENGHTFYTITFPSAEKTWSFDLATSQWHQRAGLAPDGTLLRHRAACFARWNGMQLVGDWETGALYEMTSDAYDDAGTPMIHIRSFPAISNEKKRIFLDRFVLDMEVGESPVDVEEPQVRLRWSDTRGRTWGNYISRGLGARGEFGKIVSFNRCGRAVERVFEVSWSAKVKTALNGAYIDSELGA
ncbi:hypothetical protein G3N58_15105 [Paraburkholderia sp. Ac-20342]|uniref:packaged DNA stabilization protein n=1 Tax=Paraburkholderia sp. Ac-20342 TaxID=2703889 RepID=UPI001981F495|nr:packaged DNA stabilization protein [Paraburkholderia sp. Ac-20342]MBN3848148.1 hypothetical protein [Paraburkholderia sp. Ac-20342]